MSVDNELHWYAARTRNDHEMKIKSRLTELGVDHFIPTQQVDRVKGGKKVKVDIPIVRNLIFIHATKAQALSLANGYGLPIYYIIDHMTHSIMVVPTKEMDDFKTVWDLSPGAVCLSDEPLVVGGRVRVARGDFMGIEGNVISLPNKTYVVVSIGAQVSNLKLTSEHTLGALMVAKVKLPKSYLVPVK